MFIKNKTLFIVLTGLFLPLSASEDFFFQDYSSEAILVEENNQRQESPDERFSIDFPVGWELSQITEDSSLAALSPKEDANDLFRENVLAGSFVLGPNETLWEYFYANLHYLRDKVPSLTVEISEYFLLDGKEAVRVIYKTEAEGQKYMTMQVFVVCEGRGYILTCMAEEEDYPNYSETFRDIIASFRFQ